MKINEQKLILLMAESQLSNKELSERTGLTCNTISSVRNGRSCRPESAALIARALGCKLSEIID